MTRLLDKLNLRPQERRLVIGVAVVVFVALNWFFVRPYFGELGRTQQRMKDAEISIKKFSDEIQKKPGYVKDIERLSRQGAQVPTAEMATSLTREVNNQAGGAGVNIQTLVSAPASRGDGRTNSFFEEQGVNLTFANTGEPELVNFLYNLASQKTLIRVKSMILRPDPGHMKLGGTLTLVESFQKKAPAKSAAAPAAPKPATPPAKATNSPAKTVTPAPKPSTPPGKTNDPNKSFPLPPNPKKT